MISLSETLKMQYGTSPVFLTDYNTSFGWYTTSVQRVMALEERVRVLEKSLKDLLAKLERLDQTSKESPWSDRAFRRECDAC